jgi:hypothetical protein
VDEVVFFPVAENGFFDVGDWLVFGVDAGAVLFAEGLFIATEVRYLDGTEGG